MLISVYLRSSAAKFFSSEPGTPAAARNGRYFAIERTIVLGDFVPGLTHGRPNIRGEHHPIISLRLVGMLPGFACFHRSSAPPPLSVTPTFPHFSLKTNAPPSNHPFSPFYNGADMKLSSIQPPPPYTLPNQKIPNEPICPPNHNQTQPLVSHALEAACAFPPLAAIVREDTPRIMESPVLSREEELYWLALKLVPGLGSRTSNKLLDRFRTPQAILDRKSVV